MDRGHVFIFNTNWSSQADFVLSIVRPGLVPVVKCGSEFHKLLCAHSKPLNPTTTNACSFTSLLLDIPLQNIHICLLHLFLAFSLVHTYTLRDLVSKGELQNNLEEI